LRRDGRPVLLGAIASWCGRSHEEAERFLETMLDKGACGG
jgi:hypothetical protein